MPNSFRRSEAGCPTHSGFVRRSGIPHSIFHHRIQPTLSERMAPRHAPSRHHSPAQRAIALQRFHRVFRTRRHVTARRRKRRRNPPFVKSQQPERERLHFYFSTSFFAITSKARPTSSSTTENSSVSTDFFGFISTSTAHQASRTEHHSTTA